MKTIMLLLMLMILFIAGCSMPFEKEAQGVSLSEAVKNVQRDCRENLLDSAAMVMDVAVLKVKARDGGIKVPERIKDIEEAREFVQDYFAGRMMGITALKFDARCTANKQTPQEYLDAINRLYCQELALWCMMISDSPAMKSQTGIKGKE